MRAVRVHRFGGPEVLSIDDVEDPVPGPNEVLIRIRAAGVNPADTYVRSGEYRLTPDLPFVPGGDAGGEVEAIGEGVTNLSIGDRVCVGTALGFSFFGCYAEKVVRKEEHVLKIPDNVSFAQAATLGVSYPTAHYSLFHRGRAAAGETVFIHGASGSVGTSAIQLARRAGLRVIGSAGSSDGLDLIRREGADIAVNHAQPDYLEDVRKSTDGAGPQLILEMLANQNLAADMDIAAPYGRIVVIGNRGEISINPRVAMTKELDIRGIQLWNAGKDVIDAIMSDVLAGVSDGTLNPVVGREMPLDQAATAHTAVLEAGNGGKLVLVP